MKNKIAILGGDMRQYAAAAALNNNWDVHIWGLDRSRDNSDGIVMCDDLYDALNGAVGVILPLPASFDGIYLNCPLWKENKKVRLSEITDLIDNRCVIIGGKIPAEFRYIAEGQGVRMIDYYDSEHFQIENAYITAEAAVSIAMNSLDRNICGAKIAITGYGRIAKHLVKLLKALGAEVTVAARKSSDLAWAYCSGCSVLKIDDSPEFKNNIMKFSKGFDVIYNTVPHWLFDRDFLIELDKKTFIIDLASVPGGVDICAANELKANVLWAASLPGKYAPVSAGRLIALCADSILREEIGYKC